MKLKLDANNRKFIEISIELNEKEFELKYFEKNTKQIDAMKSLAKDDKTKMYQFEDLNKEHFLENLKGDAKAIKSLINFYEENGNFYEFINECDSELGKLKSKG